MLASALTLLGINQTAAKVIEAVIFAVVIACAVVYVMSLRETAHKYDTLYAQVTGLEQKYGCQQRMASQRQLPACLEAREKDAEIERTAALNKVLASSVNVAAQLDKATTATLSLQTDTDAWVAAAPTADDGDLPRVVTDYWERERARRGMK